MDGDPAAEPELDPFSLAFPLPYRVGFIVTLAVWGWGLNLDWLSRCRIDVPALIRYPGRASPHHLSPHLSTYRLAIVLTALFSLSISTFWLFTWGVPSRATAYDWMPMTYLVALVAFFFVPLRNLPSGGRRRFFTTLRRVSIGGLAEAHDGKFGDVLLADVLTSYAKVFGDVFVMLCMFFHPGGSWTDQPDRSCGGAAIVPLLVAVPSLIRLRQCAIEYLRVRRAPYKESAGWGGQHLANALKYATAFPVLVTSALLRGVAGEGEEGEEGDGDGQGERAALFRAWLAAVLLNSLYSFYWDVVKDWDLALLSPKRERASPRRAWGLRDLLVFRSTGLYYSAVGLDLMLRCSWAMKLSPHLDKFSNCENGIFVVECLEVLRRWVWIFFRVETEWIRNRSTGLGIDDILLGDYQGKHDDDD